MPRQSWFRARRPEEGHGYSVIHWKGVVLAAALVVVMTSLVVGPWLVFGQQPLVIIGGGVLSLGALAGFMVILRARTEDWRG